MFRAQKTLNKKIIKLCTTLALPALLYGSENWTFKGRDARRITTAEMKYVGRGGAGYMWTDYKTSAETVKELNITLILDKNTGIQKKLFSTFLTFIGPCIVIPPYNKRRDALFLKFILVKNCTCFRQLYCPSSGVSTLYTQQ